MITCHNDIISRKESDMTIKLVHKLKEYEACTLCGAITDVKIKMPIDAREYYIYGVGQLCCKCYILITNKNANDNDE